MNKIDLQKRTKKFVIDTFSFANTLPANRSFNNLVNQLERAATSVGANYRAACWGKSKADFMANLGIVEEEALMKRFFFISVSGCNNQFLKLENQTLDFPAGYLPFETRTCLGGRKIENLRS